MLPAFAPSNFSHAIRNDPYIVAGLNDYMYKNRRGSLPKKEYRAASDHFEEYATNSLVKYYISQIDELTEYYQPFTGLARTAPIINEGHANTTMEVYLYVAYLIAIYLKLLQYFAYYKYKNINNGRDNDAEIVEVYNRLEHLLQTVDDNVAPTVLATSAALSCMTMTTHIDYIQGMQNVVPYYKYCMHNIKSLVFMYTAVNRSSVNVPYGILSYPTPPEVARDVKKDMRSFRISENARRVPTYLIQFREDREEEERANDGWIFDKYAAKCLNDALDDPSYVQMGGRPDILGGEFHKILPPQFLRDSSRDSRDSMDSFFDGIIDPQPEPEPEPEPANELYDRYGNSGYFDGMYAGL
ncbi:hypothetical protein EhV18_00237 [Emiliania huxleyi virus 18]|nr:hypothetical protein EhV18_00237 [Emiliania huxleyi virus 18]AHA55332.1 hypothetical protein EhV156_00236 [Emiliania huxleyi virus 156]